MILSAIVAVAHNNVIGLNGEMPWKKMRADLKFFKQKTTGKWCILGRKSYNALGNKVLPDRKFIVITRDKNFVSNDSVVVHDLESALNYPEIQSEEEVMVLGGGEIYKQALSSLNKIYLTQIHATFEGDAFFPEILNQNWLLGSADYHTSDEKNPHPYTFLVFDRK